MIAEERTKLVVANAINMVTEINEIILVNARKGVDAAVELPGLIDRAYLIFHETGIVPMTDMLDQVPIETEG